MKLECNRRMIHTDTIMIEYILKYLYLELHSDYEIATYETSVTYPFKKYE